MFRCIACQSLTCKKKKKKCIIWQYWSAEPKCYLKTVFVVSSLIEERKCTSLPSSPAKRVSQPKRKQFFINQAIRNSDLIPRAKGKKSLRRQENGTHYVAPVLQGKKINKTYWKSCMKCGSCRSRPLLWKPARHLANLLERDECSKDDLEVCSNPAIPTIFSQACTNGNYKEVGHLWRQDMHPSRQITDLRICLQSSISKWSLSLHYMCVCFVPPLLLEPWNDFMNCTGEEQERLLSLLEKEDASKKTTNRLHKDHKNGECFQLWLCLLVCLLFLRLFSLPVSLSSVHSKWCLHWSGLLPENRSQAASHFKAEASPTGEWSPRKRSELVER